MAGPIRVLLVDDHEVVREGLQRFLGEEAAEVEVVGQAADGDTALRLAQELEPDVILMDLAMPRMGGIETLRRLRKLGIGSRVLMLTTFAEEQPVRKAMEAGAIGYLLKDVGRAELLAAIRSAAADGPAPHPTAHELLVRQVTSPPAASPLDLLTEREHEVLALIAGGQSNKAIARKLKLSLGTVKGYVSAVLAKLAVTSRTQAALVALKYGVGTRPRPEKKPPTALP